MNPQLVSDPINLTGKLVCVTGATGFLGSAIVRKLEERGYQVLALSRNTSERIGVQGSQTKFISGELEDWIKAIELFRPNVFISCDWTGVEKESRNLHDQRENLYRIEKLAKVALDLGADTFVTFGTQDEVSPSTSPIPENANENAQSEYGKTKIETKNRLNKIFHSSDTRFVWGRVFTIYGPGDIRKSMITNCIQAALTKNNFPVREPDRYWSFLYVDDFLEAVMLIIENGKIKGIVNIGNPDLIKLGAAAQIIESISSRNHYFENVNLFHSPYSEPTWAPETRTLSSYSWRPRTKVQDGLLETFTWWSNKS
jgi:nucleoside-diphosphate-sugar epimerase